MNLIDKKGASDRPPPFAFPPYVPSNFRKCSFRKLNARVILLLRSELQIVAFAISFRRSCLRTQSQVGSHPSPWIISPGYKKTREPIALKNSWIVKCSDIHIRIRVCVYGCVLVILRGVAFDTRTVSIKVHESLIYAHLPV
jgi:hypothetical protein